MWDKGRQNIVKPDIGTLRRQNIVTPNIVKLNKAKYCHVKYCDAKTMQNIVTLRIVTLREDNLKDAFITRILNYPLNSRNFSSQRGSILPQPSRRLVISPGSWRQPKFSLIFPWLPQCSSRVGASSNLRILAPRGRNSIVKCQEALLNSRTISFVLS